MRYKLSAAYVKGAPAGSHGDGGGLILRKRNDHEGKWVFRYQRDKKRRDLGLGPYPTISLAKARELADRARMAVALGEDPVAARQSATSFEIAAKKYISEKVEPRLKNPKAIQQWHSTLATYAFPVFGRTSVADVTAGQVVTVLKPIWLSKSVTAKRLKGRLSNIFAWAIASGMRSESNPVEGVDDVLPHQAAKTEHHSALAWRDAPDFWARLVEHETPASFGLQFLILTACRSGEVRGATRDEVDLESAIWTIPANRMKMAREHRVPLSSLALELLEKVQGLDPKICFPSAKRNKPLSENAFRLPLKAMGLEVTAHGFRSTFRDWAAENVEQPPAVIEACLAHGNPDKVEAAYLRTDFFDRRRLVMEAWTVQLNCGTEGP